MRNINRKSIINDINDMLYELRDYGFICNMSITGENLSLEIRIFRENLSRFGFSEIDDCVSRICDYTYELGCLVIYNAGYSPFRYNGGFNRISYDMISFYIKIHFD